MSEETEYRNGDGEVILLKKILKRLNEISGGGSSDPTYDSLTISGATPNTVAYFNGSKQLASLTLGTSLSLVGSTLDAIQDIRSTATPTFMGVKSPVGSDLTLATGVGSTRVRVEDASGRLAIGVNAASSLAWGTTGVVLNAVASTFTDTNSSGTVASAVASSFQRPTFAASSPTTFTDTATVYINNSPNAGTNVTQTKAWALWVDAGLSRFDGNVIALGAQIGVSNGTTTTAWLGGTSTASPVLWTQKTSAAADTSNVYGIASYGINSAAAGTDFAHYVATGTALDSPGLVTTGSASRYRFYAHDGTTWAQVGRMGWSVVGTISSTSIPTRYSLFVSLVGTATAVEMLRVNENGLTIVGQSSRTVQTSWGTNGTNFLSNGSTITDAVSSGTVATAATNSFMQATFAASAATTFTDFATIYVENAPARGTNVTGGNPWAIWVDSGSVRFDGSIVMGAAGSSTISGATSLSITGGAGSTTIVAGTGNSRTITLQTTTSGGAATTAVVLDANQGMQVSGVVTVCSTVATPAGGSTTARLLFGTTAGFGIYYGSGAPSGLTAAQGSLYLRSDASTNATRLYVNTNGSTTWTAFNSVV